MVAMMVLGPPAVADRSLSVADPENIAITISAMTEHARPLSLTGSEFEASLSAALSDAGLSVRRADFRGDEQILFLDVIVQESVFYTSLRFWRKATYFLPDGQEESEFVPVWEGFSIGDHHQDPMPVRLAVAQIVEDFVVDYRDANGLETVPPASSPSPRNAGPERRSSRSRTVFASDAPSYIGCCPPLAPPVLP
jgi:hypothetical protein